MASGTKSKGGRPSKAKLAIGRVFGLLAVSSLSRMEHSASVMLCTCACGTVGEFSWWYLTHAEIPHCGCLYLSKTRAYRRAGYAKWKAANPDKARECQRKTHRKNRHKYLAGKLEWLRRNPDKAKAAQIKFGKAHPERVAAGKAKRRAVKRGATVGDTRVIARWEGAWRAKRRVRCYWCGGMFPPSECQSDHILALAGGGAHEVGNLCVACGPCNGRKNAKSVAVWNGSLSQPVLL